MVKFALRFLFQHIIWFVLGPLVVGLMIFFGTRGWIGAYEVNSVIYTGVTSNVSSADGTSINMSVANTNLENLINVIRSRATLERVAMRLFAQTMVYGDPERDNTYVTAVSYRSIYMLVPDEVKALIDTTSVDKTFENMMGHLQPDKKNFLYGLLNWYHPHYSIHALNNIKVRRIQGSDMVEITYSCGDPAIAYQTLLILNEEFLRTFFDLRFKDSNDIIQFFEREVGIAKGVLNEQEDSLQVYRQERRIVNYEEQTEALMAVETDHFIKLKQLLLDYAAAQSALLSMEVQLQGREGMLKNNANFMALMSDISELSASIVRAEALMPDTLRNKDPKLQQYKRELERLTNQLRTTSQTIRMNQGTKEGMPVESVLNEWLNEMVAYEKAKAAIEVMTKEEYKINDLYNYFSPIGPTLKRRDREINVAEQTYLQLTQALISARLRLKELQMSLGSVSIVTPPVYPLDSLPTRKKILVLAAMVATFVFLVSFFLIVEMLDNTLKNVFRTERLTGEKVRGALPLMTSSGEDGPSGEKDLKALEASVAGIIQQITPLIPVGKQSWIAVGSIHGDEGKSILCRLLEERFREMEFNVAWIRYEKDFAINVRDYFASATPLDLLNTGSQTQTYANRELFLLELPPVSRMSYPPKIMSGSVTNIFVCDADRAWRAEQKSKLCALKEMCQDRTMVVLNRASRDDVEMFTGLFPPYSLWRKLRFRLMNLELTSRWKN